VPSFALETWDAGRVVINTDYAALFRQCGLTTFDAVWQRTQSAAVAKNLRADRVTLRFELADGDGQPRAFYIKRHQAVPWKDYVKPLLQLSWPSVGARPEWQALLAFHAVGLATMTPVAIGETSQASFLITAALEACHKLSEREADQPPTDRREVVADVADIARRMHAAGLHHQDFYLGHLMRPDDAAGPIHVIDLGRVQTHRPWTARRWVVKDLAQLNYSAKTATATERLRFLRTYLGRPLAAADRAFVTSIVRKTDRIARHSRKNGL
jgi:heptose I phosphotransferase